MQTKRREPGYYRGKYEPGSNKSVESGYFRVRKSSDSILIEIGPSSYNLVQLKNEDAEWLRYVLDSCLNTSKN